MCVKSSFTKCYQLCQVAYGSESQVPSFFLLPNLRSICEDLIVLGFIGHMDRSDREKLAGGLMIHESDTKSKVQRSFFRAYRPYQPVMPGRMPADVVNKLEEEIRDVWKRHGWPNLSRGVMPQVRQIAEKHHLPVLPLLYDYLYRATSGTVHFNPQSLFRNGWGSLPKIEFGMSKYEGYYSAFVRVYAPAMLCMYSELLGRYLQAGAGNKEIISRIIDRIKTMPRWPEIITFEEMNIEPPRDAISPLFVALHQLSEAGSGFLR